MNNSYFNLCVEFCPKKRILPHINTKWGEEQTQTSAKAHGKQTKNGTLSQAVHKLPDQPCQTFYITMPLDKVQREAYKSNRN